MIQLILVLPVFTVVNFL